MTRRCSKRWRRTTRGAEGGNPQRNQAILLSEQAAFAHNTGSTGDGRLDLFYPKDGTPLLDYPYTLVNVMTAVQCGRAEE